MFSSGPEYLNFGNPTGSAKDLNRTVLGPISRATMNFARRTPASAAFKPYHRPERVWIIRPTFKPHTQSGFPARVPEQARLGAVLRDNEIYPAIMIEITQSGAPLFAINLNAALLRGHRLEMALSIPLQKQAAAGIISRRFGLSLEKVLCEE